MKKSVITGLAITSTLFLCLFSSCEKEPTPIPFNDQPQIIAENYQVPEYIPNNYIIDTVSTIDSIVIGRLNYEIVNGNESGAFNIDRYTGVLSIIDSSLIDYEMVNSYELDIEVTDSCKYPISDIARFKVNILDIKPTTEGLMLHLPFDGDIIDHSSMNNDGIDYSSAKYIVGIRGEAMDFNGISDYFQLKNNISCRNGLSFSFWMKPKKVVEGQQNGSIISKYNMGGNRCFFINSYHNQTESNLVLARFYNIGSSNKYFDGSYSYLDSITSQLFPEIKFHKQLEIAEDEWVHCLVNTTDSEIQIWISGQHCSTASREYSNYYDSSYEPIYIGNNYNGGSGNNNHFHGALDELRIYDRALSEEEILVLYKE